MGPKAGDPFEAVVSGHLPYHSTCFLSVVVSTCPSHGQGRRFDPSREQLIFLKQLAPPPGLGPNDLLVTRLGRQIGTLVEGYDSMPEVLGSNPGGAHRICLPASTANEGRCFHSSHHIACSNVNNEVNCEMVFN